METVQYDRRAMMDAALALDGVADLLRLGMRDEQEMTPDMCAMMREAVIGVMRVIEPEIEG